MRIWIVNELLIHFDKLQVLLSAKNQDDYWKGNHSSNTGLTTDEKKK